MSFEVGETIYHDLHPEGESFVYLGVEDEGQHRIIRLSDRKIFLLEDRHINEYRSYYR